MSEITTIPVTPFQQNCRIVLDGEGGALVIDPGGESDRIVKTLRDLDVEIREIWLTHSHVDHCGGVAALRRISDAPLSAHENEQMMRGNVREKICLAFGIPPGDMEDCPEPERFLSGGESLTFGPYEVKTLFTPGHSPGHISFYFPSLKTVISGDALFAGSIGRTDLPGGDHEQLLASIRRELWELPDETRVCSGHGPDTTIGQEKHSNPFLVGG